MRVVRTALAVGLSLLGAVGTVSAQPYGYRDRDDYRGERYRDDRYRDDGYRDRGDEYRGRGRGGYGFDEAEYLRCNPDVRRAVNSGQMESGAAHYRTFGRREGRRLSC